MPRLTILEAAIKVGFSVELLNYLIKKCPKDGEDRKLPHQVVGEEILIDEDELIAYQAYLNEPWPIPTGATRPPMRSAIANDVKDESHHQCAICGSMNGGEVAHITAVSDGACNGPDNLLYLCPNHHTAYDYGHKTSNNISREVVDAAKRMKRDSRRRIMRHEANASKAMNQLVQQIKKIQEKLDKSDDAHLKQVGATEIKALQSEVKRAMQEAAANTAADKDYAPGDSGITQISPQLIALASADETSNSDDELLEAAADVVSASSKLIIELGEVECPHCDGTGQKGLAGSFCSYCKGSCYVEIARAEQYKPELIDEVSCPRCNGSCVTGWIGDLCSFCKGDGFVTEDKAEDYTPDAIGEVPCPRCGGNGQVGWIGTFCSVCKGSCFISEERAAAYDPAELDEVDCPNCSGSGQTGLNGNLCSYCKGDCFVTHEQAASYDPGKLNEADCPRCEGRGQIGWGNNLCPFCKGDCVVSKTALAEYDPDSLDEVDCPRCNGTGQTGWAGDLCKLCKGDGVVSNEKADAYREQYE